MSNTIYMRHWHARLKEGPKPCTVCGDDSSCFTANLDDSTDVWANVQYFCDQHRPSAEATAPGAQPASPAM